MRISAGSLPKLTFNNTSQRWENNNRRIRIPGADSNLRIRNHRQFGTRIREIHEHDRRHHEHSPIHLLRGGILDQLTLEEIVIRHPTPSSEDPSPVSRFHLPD